MPVPCALKTTPRMVVAARRCAGDARQVAEAFLQVAEWLKERELPMRPWIGVFRDAPGGESHVDPRTRELQAEVWIPFDGEARGDGAIEVRAIEPQRVASAVHEGDVALIGETVRELKAWIRRQGLYAWPEHRQIYLAVVPGEPASPEWRTEVQIPIR